MSQVALEGFDDVPDLAYAAFIGFSGHLLRGLCVMPDGEEFIYAAGSHVAFNRIQEREVRNLGNERGGHGGAPTRRTGGGYTAPRQRALGGQTNDYLGSTVEGSTGYIPSKRRGAPVKDSGPGGLNGNSTQITDTNVMSPGNFVRPTLVAGHTQDISCLALSGSGKYLVSGTVTNYGFVPELIVWDTATRKALALITQHKTSIIDVAISPDEAWFVSLGEDGWIIAHSLDEASGYAPYKAFAGLKIQSNRPPTAIIVLESGGIVLGGEDFLCFCDLDLAGRVFHDNPVRLPLRRKINCFRELDGLLYAGTESGDVIKIDPGRRVATQVVPAKKPFPGAVTAIVPNGCGNLLVSTSASKVYLVRADTMAPVAVNDLPGDTQVVSASAAFTSAATSAVSSSKTAAVSAAAGDKEAAAGDGHLAVVNAVANGVACLAVAASGASEYALALGPNCFCRVNKSTLESRLLQTAPPAITTPLGTSCVAFPYDCARVCASACGSFVSVWSLVTGRELVRVSVPGVRALSVIVSEDGCQLVSGWSDGAIRSHAPQTGRALWVAEKAHEDGVTAVAQCRGGAYLVSGGRDGRVCLWEVRDTFQRLVQVQKGHKGAITSCRTFVLDNGDEELVTTCSSGMVQLFRLTHGQIFNKQDALQHEPVKLELSWASRAEGGLAGGWELRDGSQVVCCGTGGMLWLQCGRANGSIARALPLPLPATACYLYEEDGGAEGAGRAKVLVGLRDGHVLVVDYDSGEVERKLHVLFGEVRCIAVSTVDAVAVASGNDGSIVAFCL
ncbi:WD40 repeat protein [Giardia muris]|uniref:Cilia- and flagella-associated protein 52 n=1 Tax=Giardia muris TaxID=5742 RepID=A0A4Z1SMF2_GIAMU|nr:WD40 repeat protein [Giardia muris]|eukprot:TNJ26866.1 WD40 repeat protein [Giardia muris]